MSEGDNRISNSEGDNNISKQGIPKNAYDVIKAIYQNCEQEQKQKQENIDQQKEHAKKHDAPEISGLLTRRLQDAYRSNIPLQAQIREALEMLNNAQRAQHGVTGESVGKLGRRHSFSQPETAPEQASGIMESLKALKREQEKVIITNFVQDYHRAKKVRDLLIPFFDGYADHQKALKNNVSLDQLQAMHSFIQTFLDHMEKIKFSDQQFAGKFKEFFESHLSTEPYQFLGRHSGIALEYMTKWQEELAAFSKGIGQFSITTIEQLQKYLTSFLDKLESSFFTTTVTGIEPTGSLEEAKQTFCFEQLVAVSDVLGKNLKALDFKEASNWDDVRLLEISGKNATRYNERVTRLHPWIEEIKQLLAGQTDDGRRQVIGQYMVECKKSILVLHALISKYGDTIEIPDIFDECDKKKDIIESSKEALEEQRGMIRAKQKIEVLLENSSTKVQYQMSAYIARCLERLKSYGLACDRFFKDQQGKIKKPLDRDSAERVNTELYTIVNDMFDTNNEMRRAFNKLMLRKKEARPPLSEDDRKTLERSKRYWDKLELFIDKSSIDRIFENYQPSSYKMLLETLNQNSYLRELCEGGIGFPDKRTCGERAEERLRLFESCYGNKPWKFSVLTKNEFRLLLALKGIGESEAYRLLSKMLQWLKIPKEKSEIILSLATQRYIQEYMHHHQIPMLCAKHLSSEAARLGITTQEYFHLAKLFYMCDAGSESAGGTKFRDPHLKFHYDNKQLTKMKFSQQTKKTFDELVESINRISAGQDKMGLDLDWVGSTHIAVGGSFTSGQIKALGYRRITSVVDAREERCDDEKALAGADISWLHLPTPDRHPLSLKQLVEGTKWVLPCLERGEHVLIHDEFERERSVQLMAAVEVALGKTAKEALELIRKNRPQANLTAPQFERLLEFEDHWKQLQFVRAHTASWKPGYVAEPVRHLVLDTLQQGDLNQALTYAQHGLSLRETANFKTSLPLDHLLLSTIYQKKEDTVNALLHAQKASAIAAEMKDKKIVKLANDYLERFNERDRYQTFSSDTAKNFMTAYENLSHIYDNSSSPHVLTLEKSISDPEMLPPLEHLEKMRSDLMELQKQVKELKPSDESSQEGTREQSLPAFTADQTQKLEKAIEDMKGSKAEELSNSGKQILDEIKTLLDANNLPKAAMIESDGKQLRENMEALSKHILQKGKQFEEISRGISNSMQAYSYLANAIQRAETQLRPVSSDASVRSYWQALEAAKQYRDQRHGTTRAGLEEQAETLEAHRIQLDEALEQRTRAELEKWSEWSKKVGDVRYVQPEHSMISTFQLADVLDFERVAEDVEKALQQGKPEDIYRELHTLQWQPEAVKKMNTAYKSQFGKPLETALKDHFGEQQAQLKHALQYINIGEPIKPLPASLQDLATSLHTQLAKPTGEPEELYTILASLRRSTDNLDGCYMDKFGTTLEADIQEKLEGRSKDYAAYLAGGRVMEKNVRSFKEAERLCKAISKMPVNWDDGVSGPLTYDILFSSELRAHFTYHALREIGIASDTCFARSVRLDNTGKIQGNLRVPILFASDMPPDQEPATLLESRVAALIQVETPFGVRELLWDSDQQLTVKQWTSEMGQDDFKRLSLEEYNELNPDLLYSGETYIYTTSDAIASPEAQSKLIADNNAFTTGRKLLIDAAGEVPYHEIAGFIHKNKHTILDNASAEAFFNNMAAELFKQVGLFGFSFISDTAFSDVFPKLYQELRKRLKETNVSGPTRECFESLLSEKSIFSKAHRDQDSFSAKQRELSEKFEQAKNEYITEKASRICDKTRKIVDSYRKTHPQEIEQVIDYFTVCMKNMQNCVKRVEECDIKKTKYDVLSPKVNELLDANKEIREALIPILEERKRHPTLPDLLRAHKPPKELLEWHEEHSRQHWEEIARIKAEEEFGHKITIKEFKMHFQDYLNHYLKMLDDHAQKLVALPDIQIRIRRRAHKVLEILVRGRILSMFETQTAGSETTGTVRQAQIEKYLYGFPLNYPPALRPLYTAITEGFYTGDVGVYGTVAIKLKPSVRLRTTKLMYISSMLAHLGTHGVEDHLVARPVPFNEPGRDCFPLTDPSSVFENKNATQDEEDNAFTVFSEKDPLEFATPNDITPWLEGHVQQGLTIDDIERIDFSPEFDDELARALDKTVSDEQKEALSNLLHEDEKNEIEHIETQGFVGVMRNILYRQHRDHSQFNKELLGMYTICDEALSRSIEDYKSELKELLAKRGIPYSGL